LPQSILYFESYYCGNTTVIVFMELVFHLGFMAMLLIPVALQCFMYQSEIFYYISPSIDGGSPMSVNYLTYVSCLIQWGCFFFKLFSGHPAHISCFFIHDLLPHIDTGTCSEGWVSELDCHCPQYL